MHRVRCPQLRARFETRFQKPSPRYGPTTLTEDPGLNQ